MEISTLTTSPVSAPRWWRIHLRRRQGLANRLRSELDEDGPQGLDARGEGIAGIVDGAAKLLDESSGFVV
jgi:hypothetical protein